MEGAIQKIMGIQKQIKQESEAGTGIEAAILSITQQAQETTVEDKENAQSNKAGC